MEHRDLDHNRQWRRLALTVLAGAALIVPFVIAKPAEAKKPVRLTTTTSTTIPATTSTTTTPTPLPPPPGSSPTAPPVQICGVALILDGPAEPPAGAVRVQPGQNLNSATQNNPAGTTFYLTAGVHTLDASQYAQVITKDGNTYVGAPGAVLDGQRVNRYAFFSGWPTQAVNVTIKHLTVQNFVAPVNEGVINPGAAPGWTIERNTIAHNGGHGLYIGANNVVRNNCIDSNGQGGFGTYRGLPGDVTNVVVDGNEITRNNTEDWESKIANCGCTAGGKFWEVTGARATNNWVHHNKAVGLWADVNNVDMLFEGNLIEDNDREGLFYEVSYNVVIRHNTLRRNALVKGKQFEGRTDFPVGAIYISESGGDKRVQGVPSVEIHDNVFLNNWGGVILYEGADRFCGAPAHVGGGCTLVNTSVTNGASCVKGTINHEPHYSDCRWKTQNVNVHHNVFAFDRGQIGCTSKMCGRQGLISSMGKSPSWSPYKGKRIKEAVTFEQNNLFSTNRYVGPWRFAVYDSGRTVSFSSWQKGPYNQDMGSTLVSQG